MRGTGPASARRQANAPSTEPLDEGSGPLLWKVYRWAAELVDRSTSLHGQADRVTWLLLWTVYDAKKPRQVAMAVERIGLAGDQPKTPAALAEPTRSPPREHGRSVNAPSKQRPRSVT